MVSVKYVMFLTLAFNTNVYGFRGSTIIKSVYKNLPTKKNGLYFTLFNKKPIFKHQGCGLFGDLRSLEKRVPSKKLSKPRNITSSTVKDLFLNYKYSVLPFCPEILVRRGSCICSKTFLYSSFIRDKRKNLFAVTGVDTAIKTVLISYRGTISLKNMIADFDCELIQYPVAKEGVLVHKGIYEATTVLQHRSEEAIYSLLKNPKYKGYKFLITGYSLGAAMATISSLRWKDFLKENKLSNQIEVLAYSSPRVGNEGFAQLIADGKYSVTRYTNTNDIIPHLPSRNFNFVHAGTEIHERNVSFLKTEFVYCDQSYDEDPNCGQRQFGPYSVVRHALILNKPLKLPFC